MKQSAWILAVTASTFVLPVGCESSASGAQTPPPATGDTLGPGGGQLAKEPAAPTDTARRKLADVDTLMVLLEKLDGPGLSRELEHLLLAGEPGFAVVYGFFHRCDVEREKMITLTHDSQMLFALLRLVARFPDDVAKLCFFLADATADHTGSYIRREIFNFVPEFVNYHRGRYPELRARLKKEIVYQLENRGDYLYKVTLAMRDLEFNPPVASFLPVLLDPTKKEVHAQVIRHLTERGGEGLEALLRYVDEAGNHGLSTIPAAMKAIARLDTSEDQRVIRRFMDDPRMNVRHAAFMVYFEEERTLEAVPLAIGFLNSDVSLRRKRVFIGLLRRKNPAIAEAVREQREKIASDDVRKIFEKPSRRRRKARASTTEKNLLNEGTGSSKRETGLAEKSPRPGAAAKTTTATSTETITATIVALIEKHDGAGLYRELQKYLTGGDEGFLVLHDILRYLDDNRRTGELLALDYRNTFGLMHLAMLHDVELARFTQYYLLATKDVDARALSREKLYTFIPVFLEFYPGRFTELEGALKDDIHRLLSARLGNLSLLLSAARSLRFQPEIALISERLQEARDYRQTSLLLDHLAERDSREAVRLLVRFIDAAKDDRSSRAASSGQKLQLALRALAAMTDAEAEQMLARYLRSPVTASHAARAYFSVPRPSESSDEALRYLNSEANLAATRAFLNLLRANNPVVLKVVLARAEEIRSAETRNAVEEAGKRL